MICCTSGWKDILFYDLLMYSLKVYNFAVGRYSWFAIFMLNSKRILL